MIMRRGKDEAGASWLAEILSAPGSDTARARQAYGVLMTAPALREALMLPRNLIPRIARLPDAASRLGRAPGPDTAPDAALMLPLWVIQADWCALLSETVMRALADWPGLPDKLSALAPEAGPALETALSGARPFARPRRPEAAQLGLYAAALAVHGRYQRALDILHWLDRMRPGQPETAHRIASVCWQAGNAEAGARWDQVAIGAAPGNALLHLSSAARLTAAGKDAPARRHRDEAARLWPELAQQATLWRRAGGQGSR